MMQKILCLFLAAILLLGLVGCTAAPTSPLAPAPTTPRAPATSAPAASGNPGAPPQNRGVPPLRPLAAPGKLVPEFGGGDDTHYYSYGEEIRFHPHAATGQSTYSGVYVTDYATRTQKPLIDPYTGMGVQVGALRKLRLASIGGVLYICTERDIQYHHLDGTAPGILYALEHEDSLFQWNRYTDEQSLYTTVCHNADAEGEAPLYEVLRIALATGNAEVIYRFAGSTFGLCHAQGDILYAMQPDVAPGTPLADEPGALDYTLVAIHKNTGEATALFTGLPEEAAMGNLFWQHTMYDVHSEPSTLLATNLDTGETTAHILETEEDDGPFLLASADEGRVLVGQWPHDGGEPTYRVVDTRSGSTRPFTLRYSARAASGLRGPMPYSPLARTGSHYLVTYDLHYQTKAGRAAETGIAIPQYALISVEDYWNSVANYTPIVLQQQ